MSRDWSLLVLWYWRILLPPPRLVWAFSLTLCGTELVWDCILSTTIISKQRDLHRNTAGETVWGRMQDEGGSPGPREGVLTVVQNSENNSVNSVCHQDQRARCSLMRESTKSIRPVGSPFSSLPTLSESPAPPSLAGAGTSEPEKERC